MSVASPAPRRLDPLAFGRSDGIDMPSSSAAGGLGMGRSDMPSDSGLTATGGIDSSAPAAPPSRQARPRNVAAQEDIPPVTDETGERVREGFADFLERYTEEAESGSPDPDGEAQGTPIYIDQIYALREYKKTTLFVDFAHVLRYEEVLARAISDQYYRFLPYLRRALLDLVNTYVPGYLYLNAHTAATASSGLVPRDFSVSFYNLSLVSGLRELRTDKIGRLLSISGTVTRTSEVRPELLYGTFTCGECKTVVRDVEQQFKYTEPTMCRNAMCRNRRAWSLNVDQSRFSDWQKVRIQENASEIPTGSMPRSLDVILRSEVVERAKAGDRCVFTGTFIVVPDVAQLGVPGSNAQIQREAAGGRGPEGATQGVSGLKSLGVRDLTYRTAFLACMVQSANDRKGADSRDEGDAADPDAVLDSLTDAERDELEAMVAADDIYGRLVQSIAPTVYGHDIVKKGILLQLMGGVHKQTHEGIHLRGDINVCIVGDPSTSKSQFLKYVCGFLPRAVYTSGKASSAAGLTAAVVRDEETGEFTIEAGALMLADNGICAIDEFDKMDVSDQVAIHEAMEQQTISIAKAGLQATLNARTSILAAANPVGGRYNRRLTLRANVAMSAPILSRFDLFFVVLDECDEQVDASIAQHIVNVHRFRDAALAPEFSTAALQRYIRFARTFQPKLTPEAADVLVDTYRRLRQDDAAGAGRSSSRITVRQLESLIRLSEAIARANCRSDITPAFVREAYSLLKQSIIRVDREDVEVEGEEQVEVAQSGATAEGADMEPSSSLNAAGEESQSQAAAAAGEESSSAAAPSAPRNPIRLTYDRYMELANLLVLRVSEVERSAATGIPREDLVQWYLEQREVELHSVEQLNAERDLVTRVVAKLVRDAYLIEAGGEVDEDGEDTQTQAQSMQTDDATPQAQRLVLLVHPRIDVDSLADGTP